MASPKAASAALLFGRRRRTGGASPEGHIEHPRQVGGRDAATAVGDREPPVRVLLATGERDRAVGRGVPDRVAQQVGHNPGQLRLAPLYGRPAGLCGDQPDSAGGGHWRRRGDGVRHDIAKRDGVQRKLQGAGVDPGQFEQIVHKGRHPVGLHPDPAVVVRDRIRVADDAVLQRLGHRAEAGQRRAQVVRDPGDQFPPVRLHLPLPQPYLIRPHRVGGESAAEPDADREAHPTGEREHDQEHINVVVGDEHALGDAEDAGEHRQHGDRQQDADGHDDRAVAQRPQHEPARQRDHEGAGERDEQDQREVLHATPAS